MDAAIWLSLASGLIGSLIGAFTTWLVTKDSIYSQYRNQMKINNMQELKSHMTSYRSVLKEIEYNRAHLDALEQVFKKAKVDDIIFENAGLPNGFKSVKWEKHSDVLFHNLISDRVGIIAEYYVQIDLAVNWGRISKSTLHKLKEATGICMIFLHEESKKLLNDFNDKYPESK